MKKLIFACFSTVLLAVLYGCANGNSLSSGGDPSLHHAPGGPGVLPDAPSY